MARQWVNFPTSISSSSSSSLSRSRRRPSRRGTYQRSTARLQRSLIGRVESFRSWSNHLWRGRPGGRRMNDEVLVWLSLYHRISHKYQLSQMDPRDVLLRLELHCFDLLWICCTICLQCVDTVGWAPEKHPARKTLLMRCWCCYLFLQGTLLFLDSTQRHEDNATRDTCSNRPHLRTPGRAIPPSNSNNKSGSGKWVFASESGSSMGLERGRGVRVRVRKKNGRLRV